MQSAFPEGTVVIYSAQGGKGEKDSAFDFIC
jgi:hypothetical protein